MLVKRQNYLLDNGIESPESCFCHWQPEKFVNLGIDPPKGVLLFGPPGTGKTLCARAVANRTDACFVRVIGSELVQKYVGEVWFHFRPILLNFTHISNKNCYSRLLDVDVMHPLDAPRTRRLEQKHRFASWTDLFTACCHSEMELFLLNNAIMK